MSLVSRDKKRDSWLKSRVCMETISQQQQQLQQPEWERAAVRRDCRGSNVTAETAATLSTQQKQEQLFVSSTLPCLSQLASQSSQSVAPPLFESCAEHEAMEVGVVYTRMHRAIGEDLVGCYPLQSPQGWARVLQEMYANSFAIMSHGRTRLEPGLAEVAPDATCGAAFVCGAEHACLLLL